MTYMRDKNGARLDTLALADLSSAYGDGQILTEPALIDLCGPGWTQSPGDDISAALQQAITQLADAGTGGRIVIAQPTTESNPYLLDGASQTGSALGYSYAGQVLLPATDYLNGAIPISLEGGVVPSSGDSTTGLAQGVVIQSSATTGYMLDTVPHSSQWGGVWTGVMPIFKDIIFRAPDNPTCGGLNIQNCLRARLIGHVGIDVPSGWTYPSAGNLPALWLPNMACNNDVSIEDLDIRFWPKAIILGEHLIANKVVAVGCPILLQGNGVGHKNTFNYLDAEECGLGSGGAIVHGGTTPTNSEYTSGTVVDIKLDVDTETSSSFAAGAIIRDESYGSDPAAPVIGQIDLLSVGAYGLPIVGGYHANLARLDQGPTGNVGVADGLGWKAKHPYDSFERTCALPLTVSDGAPGQCYPSGHPWRVESGEVAVATNGSLTLASGNSAWVFVPPKQAGVGIDRTVYATISLGASGSCALLVASSSVEIDGSANGGGQAAAALQMQVGQPPQFQINSGVIWRGATSLTANTTYVCAIQVLNSPLGQVKGFRVFIDGALQTVYMLTAGQISGYVCQPSAAYPYVEDGLAFLDSAPGLSSVSLFYEKDAPPDPLPSTLVKASTTHTAFHTETTLCTSGTFTVTLPQPVANVENRVINSGSGTITVTPASGTLYSLSGASGNISLNQAQPCVLISDDTDWYQVG